MFRDLWGTQCREMISISQEWNPDPGTLLQRRKEGRGAGENRQI